MGSYREDWDVGHSWGQVAAGTDTIQGTKGSRKGGTLSWGDEAPGKAVNRDGAGQP